MFPSSVADAIEHSAAPARVGTALRRLADDDPSLLERVESHVSFRRALVAVLGSSRSLTRLCETDPEAISVLTDLDRRVTLPVESPDDVVRWKQLEFLRIAARDLVGTDDLEAVGAALAEMADRVLDLAWRLGDADGVAVIGMGKYGACELNYASDVDLMFVGSGDIRALLATARRCFRVDADLRPEGRDGSLVRSLEAFEAYWSRWAKTWEFQALLKARPAAGEAELGDAFGASAARALWQRPFGADEVREVRAMKAQAEREMARLGLTDRELKRGRGGIRDIEFAVQLLQLVHGGNDRAIRSAATLPALDELAQAGYVDGDDAAQLGTSYRFLRMVEHRLQLWDEAQVHAIPNSAEALDRLARVCGYRGGEGGEATALFMADLRRHQSTVRALHEQLFFRPLMGAFAGVRAMPVGMSDAAVVERLAAFGFADARQTRTALRELTSGLTRRSRLMQRALPLVLEWLSESPDPDGGLLGLRTLVGRPHQAEALVRLARDAPDGMQRICTLLGSSRLVTDGLERHPELVADLADPRQPRQLTREELDGAIRTALAWRGDVADQAVALRRLQSGSELGIAVRDLLGVDHVDTVAGSLTTLAEGVLSEALRLAMETTGATVPIALIAMGRFGGNELSYASDLDVIAVHGGSTDIGAAAAERVVSELRRIVNGITPASQLYRLDLDLRPEGKDGLLSRSLGGYEQYYERWAQTWERQALLRGRFVAGDDELGAAFSVIASAFVRRDVTGDDEREIRRMKARIERERIPAGDDPDFHLKVGRGGLADVEWTVQLLQLRHGVYGVPGTMAALDVLVGSGHLDEVDASALAAAYRFCERTRNRLYLVRGSPGDALPARPEQLGKLARSLGSTAGELRDEYRRVTRRCREVTERLFYGAGGAPAVRPVPGTWRQRPT